MRPLQLQQHGHVSVRSQTCVCAKPDIEIHLQSNVELLAVGICLACGYAHALQHAFKLHVHMRCKDAGYGDMTIVQKHFCPHKYHRVGSNGHTRYK